MSTNLKYIIYSDIYLNINIKKIHFSQLIFSTGNIYQMLSSTMCEIREFIFLLNYTFTRITSLPFRTHYVSNKVQAFLFFLLYWVIISVRYCNGSFCRYVSYDGAARRRHRDAREALLINSLPHTENTALSRPRGMKLRGKRAVRVFHSRMNARRGSSFVRENEEPRAVVTRE